MDTGERMRIHLVHQPGAVIGLHPAWIPQRAEGGPLGLVCSFGSNVSVVQVLADPSLPSGVMTISPAVHRDLLGQAELEVLRASVAGDEVTIGPLIGILCSPVWKEAQGTLQATKQLPSLQKMCEIGRREGAMVCVFGIRDMDFERQRVQAYVWNGKRWRKVVLPFPDVIYDQVISRKVERAYQRKRKRLGELYRGRIFNDGFFDKWQVHEWLTSDQRTRPHVPKTIRFTPGKATSEFIRVHNPVFLKPVHGSLGFGIIRVIRQSDGSYSYDVKRRGAREHGTSPTHSALLQFLRGRIGRKPYLVQQGLTLAKYRERPFDIRIVLQRDGSGDWRRTKVFARVAQPGDFTSNLTSGGEALPVQVVNRAIYAQKAARVRCRREILRVSHLVAAVLEEQSGRLLGELGIDIGLDEDGHVWVIEVNSKPWKRPYTEKGRQDLVDLAFTRPIQYAIHLASRR
ncbi:MAG: YheC/YheD family protein [Alicyclobacillus sp.]|nr:YheC/YheD family protein [Alicyclobacillus sp.]